MAYFSQSIFEINLKIVNVEEKKVNCLRWFYCAVYLSACACRLFKTDSFFSIYSLTKLDVYYFSAWVRPCMRLSCAYVYMYTLHGSNFTCCSLSRHLFSLSGSEVS